MITEADLLELEDILFSIMRMANTYRAMNKIEPAAILNKEAFVEQVRMQAHHIEGWCDTVKYRVNSNKK